MENKEIFGDIQVNFIHGAGYYKCKSIKLIQKFNGIDYYVLKGIYEPENIVDEVWIPAKEVFVEFLKE